MSHRLLLFGIVVGFAALLANGSWDRGITRRGAIP